MEKRIGLLDMDIQKYFTLGSLYIVIVDALLFPLGTVSLT